jgi:hypothetical protein
MKKKETKKYAHFEFLGGFLKGKERISENEYYRPIPEWKFAFHNRGQLLASMELQETMEALPKHIIVFEYKERGKDYVLYQFKEIL